MIFEISFLTNVNILQHENRSHSWVWSKSVLNSNFFFLTNLIPAFNTSAFLKKKRPAFRWGKKIPQASDWVYVFLQTENYPCVALTRSPLLTSSLEIVFLYSKVFEIVKVRSSTLLGAFFRHVFLICTSRLRGRHSSCLVFLLGLFTFARIACVLQLWIKTSDLENSIWVTPK